MSPERAAVLLSVLFALAAVALGYIGAAEREQVEAARAALGEEEVQ